jgi:hypothetical protein
MRFLTLAFTAVFQHNKQMYRLISLAGVVFLGNLPALFACEGCKEPSNVAGQSGVAGISASFSWSVLFMLGVTAFLLTGLVLMMIRSCKQLAALHNPNAAYVTRSSAGFSVRRAVLQVWRGLCARRGIRPKFSTEVS